jgi:predicted transcriptional regulator
MTDLVLEAYDKFALLYDLVALVGEGTGSEPALAFTARLSRDVVGQMLAFMLEQGYVKSARSDGEFKLTVLGSDFLRDYEGMRKFLS